MDYSLPTRIEFSSGESFAIRNKGDFRVVLDVITALNDPDLKQEEMLYCILYIFYEDYDDMDESLYQEAIEKMYRFIDLNRDSTIKKKQPKLMDWEQDFDLIVNPINRIMGTEVRSMEYLHWWTFIGAYNEIGECAFSNIVSIRSKKAKGKKLEKWEQEFYRDNSDRINFHKRISSEDRKILDEIMNGMYGT